MFSPEVVNSLVGWAAGAVGFAGVAGMIPSAPACLASGALMVLLAPQRGSPPKPHDSVLGGEQQQQRQQSQRQLSEAPPLHAELAAATFLGAAFVAGVWAVAEVFPERWELGAYVCVLSAFHFGEYLSTALFKPADVSFDSFLLNHSTAYGVALATGVVEYVVEGMLLPASWSALLRWPTLCAAGLCMSIAGDAVRKYAMYTARESFSHLIVEKREEDHKLVTTGIYAVSRHPAYFGWFYWSVGTQLLLCNPLCTVAYAVASWQFFADRIPYEEELLLKFFGQDYFEYQKRTAVGIPFIPSAEPSPYQFALWTRQEEVRSRHSSMSESQSPSRPNSQSASHHASQPSSPPP